jgi:hypothetical protein
LVPSRPRFLQEAHGGQGSAGNGRRGGLNAAKGLYDQRHYLVALIVTRVVVVAPVEGDVALACLVVKGGEAAGAGAAPDARRQAAGAAAKDARGAATPPSGVAKGDQ